jgi:hypothetical protein
LFFFSVFDLPSLLQQILGRAKEFHDKGLTTLTIDFYYGKLPIDNEEVFRSLCFLGCSFFCTFSRSFF